jgi:hypothetical protein
MRRSYEIREIVDEPRLIDAIQRFVERRAASHRPEDVVTPENADADEFAKFAPGNTYGRFHEKIVRRELRRAGTPEWFDPREHEGQYGIIGTSPLRCYIQVELDIAARDQPSVFDQQIMNLVEATPEQTSMFA